MFMISDIPSDELEEFKGRVKEWLQIDTEIKEYQSKIKELRKRKDKELEPQITMFMRDKNIDDLNTESGKLKCSARNTKSTLNKQYIRDNLMKTLDDVVVVEKAMDNILNNREVKTKFVITKVKKK
jgi:predicted  nucleic acid-binding Zn-ribbon protein